MLPAGCGLLRRGSGAKRGLGASPSRTRCTPCSSRTPQRPPGLHHKGGGCPTEGPRGVAPPLLSLLSLQHVPALTHTSAANQLQEKRFRRLLQRRECFTGIVRGFTVRLLYGTPLRLGFPSYRTNTHSRLGLPLHQPASESTFAVCVGLCFTPLPAEQPCQIHRAPGAADGDG
jgi:hypothetical protein